MTVLAMNHSTRKAPWDMVSDALSP